MLPWTRSSSGCILAIDNDVHVLFADLGEVSSLEDHLHKYHYRHGEFLHPGGAATAIEAAGTRTIFDAHKPSKSRSPLGGWGVLGRGWSWHGWLFLLLSLGLHLVFVAFGPSASAKRPVSQPLAEKMFVTFGVETDSAGLADTDEEEAYAPELSPKQKSSSPREAVVTPKPLVEKVEEVPQASSKEDTEQKPSSVVQRDIVSASEASTGTTRSVGRTTRSSRVGAGSSQSSSKQARTVASSKTLGSGLGPWATRIGRLLLKRARRAYPFAARKNRLEGIVHIAFQINSQGALQTVSIKKSSGSPLLDQAALASVRQIGRVPAPPGVSGSFKKSFVLPVSYRLNN